MPPIVVDLGWKPKKQIVQLKKGEGPIVLDVIDVLTHISRQLSEDLDGRPLAPVVIICREKARPVLPGALRPGIRS